ANVPLATRATIGNLSPEYGATATMFPTEAETLDYMRLTGRDEHQIQLVEQYAREQGLWHDPEHVPDFTRIVDLDLSSVEPSIAGPRRPQDRIALGDAPRTVLRIPAGQGPTAPRPSPPPPRPPSRSAPTRSTTRRRASCPRNSSRPMRSSAGPAIPPRSSSVAGRRSSITAMW